MKFGFANVSINYNKCCDCDFIFTVDFDDWSEKDFSENIYNDDYIRVDGEYPVVRPQRMADNVSKLLKNFKNERLLDYGSGSGVFERKIRQSGFENVSSFDPFSNPIRPSGQFSIVTAFEVVEHSTDPIGIFTDMLSFANNEAIIIISTGLQPKNIAELGLSWWYIAPRNGHVSIYSIDSMVAIARKFGLKARFGQGLCIFAPHVCERYKDFLDDFGPAYETVTLFAPGHGGDGWNGVENGFQWTNAEIIKWKIKKFPPGLVNIQIPIVHEVTQGHLNAAKLTINGEFVLLTRLKKYLVGQYNSRLSNEVEIILFLPPPKQPSTLRESLDTRHLGVAVSVRPESP